MPTEFKASIITTCKGRLHHLRATLPNMLSQQCDFPYEVIVVDYGCPDNTFDWCVQLNDSRLLVIRVEDDVAEFNLSRARNCGATHAAGRILAFVDADVFISSNWLSVVCDQLRNHGLATVKYVARNGWECCGSCAVRADVYHAVRGYDEAFHGWGSEDNDFYRRCSRVTTTGNYNPQWVMAIRHDHADRHRYYGTADIWASNTANARLMNDTSRQVNREGYGQCTAQVFRGAQSSVSYSPVQFRGPRQRMRIRV
ncbi:MAG: glycosyltransferase [bacterium]|nr:glycosyltransferase [bacterium]